MTHDRARYRLWVSDDRTVLVREWDTGAVEVATRPTPDHVWGPPVKLTEQAVDSRADAMSQARAAAQQAISDHRARFGATE